MVLESCRNLASESSEGGFQNLNFPLYCVDRDAEEGDGQQELAVKAEFPSLPEEPAIPPVSEDNPYTISISVPGQD